MSLFPKIESPCPYKDDLVAIMDGDVCRMCEREVFDLTFMSGAERQAFLGSCSGEICVSYKIPVARMVTAAAIASAAMLSVPAVSAQSADDLYCYDDVIFVGGLKKGASAEYVEVKSDLPNLPVVYSNGAELEEFERMFGMRRKTEDKAVPAAKTVREKPLTVKRARKPAAKDHKPKA